MPNFGVCDEKLADVWSYASSPFYSERERTALDFALAAAAQPNAVTDELFSRLQEHWSDNEIVEILGVVSMFGFLNRWNDTMATPLETCSSPDRAAGRRRARLVAWQTRLISLALHCRSRRVVRSWPKEDVHARHRSFTEPLLHDGPAHPDHGAVLACGNDVGLMPEECQPSTREGRLVIGRRHYFCTRCKIGHVVPHAPACARSCEESAQNV